MIDFGNEEAIFSNVAAIQFVTNYSKTYSFVKIRIIRDEKFLGQIENSRRLGND